MNPENSFNLPAELPIARYRFSFQMVDNLSLPHYAGSTLRGVFGHALRRLACMTRQKECIDCPLLETCPYSRIFATPPSPLLNKSQQQNPPQPYIIEAPSDGVRDYSAGSIFSFDMVLIGYTRLQLPLITYAFQQAFEHGVGWKQARGILIDVAVQQENNWQSVYQKQSIISHTQMITLPQHYPDNITLEFYTPLRLQQRSKVLSIEQLNGEILLGQLLRRVSTLAVLYWQALDADYSGLISTAKHIPYQKKLYWQDWARYSNRQQQGMKLGGALGTWQFENLPLPFRQLLYIGQWLHIGKETVFGHGGYILKANE